MRSVYLKGPPFDTLKVDRCLVSGPPNDPAGAAAVVTAIATLGNSPGFEVPAEGVET